VGSIIIVLAGGSISGLLVGRLVGSGVVMFRRDGMEVVGAKDSRNDGPVDVDGLVDGGDDGRLDGEWDGRVVVVGSMDAVGLSVGYDVNDGPVDDDGLVDGGDDGTVDGEWDGRAVVVGSMDAVGLSVGYAVGS